MITFDDIADALERADKWCEHAPADMVALVDQTAAQWRELGIEQEDAFRAAVGFAMALQADKSPEEIASVSGIAATFLGGLRSALMALQYAEEKAA